MRLNYKMPRGFVKATLGVSLATFAFGCGGGTTVITDDQDLIVSNDRIDPQDWERAAADMSESLLRSPSVARIEKMPATLVISRIIPEIDEQVDTDRITKRIRIALSNSGKFETSTTEGVGGRPEDPYAKGSKDKEEFYNDTPVPARRADYSLSGKIISDKSRAGDVRQASYIFQLSLTDLRTGNAIWEEERRITKQGKKNSVGW